MKRNIDHVRQCHLCNRAFDVKHEDYYETDSGYECVPCFFDSVKPRVIQISATKDHIYALGSNGEIYVRVVSDYTNSGYQWKHLDDTPGNDTNQPFFEGRDITKPPEIK